MGTELVEHENRLKLERRSSLRPLCEFVGDVSFKIWLIIRVMGGGVGLTFSRTSIFGMNVSPSSLIDLGSRVKDLKVVLEASAIPYFESAYDNSITLSYEFSSGLDLPGDTEPD